MLSVTPKPRASALSAGEPVRILIVSDICFYREGLEEFLGRQGYFQVVGTATDSYDAVAKLDSVSPDVVLLDVTTPRALATVSELTSASSRLRVLVLGIAEIEHEVVACAEAGVAGFVTRDTSLSELVSTVEHVALGGTSCSPAIASALLRRLATLGPQAPPSGPEQHLTRRETQVAALMQQGLSNKQIAKRLGIELPTVKNHVHNILGKLQAQSRGEAVARLRPSPPLAWSGVV